MANITKDNTGRKYASVKTLKAGDYVTVDDGFTCMRAGTRKRVHSDEKGSLYVKCRDGHHHLDGQHNDRGTHYIGVYPIDPLTEVTSDFVLLDIKRNRHALEKHVKAGGKLRVTIEVDLDTVWSRDDGTSIEFTGTPKLSKIEPLPA